MWARTVAAGRVLALSLGVVVASLLLVGPAGAATTISSHGDASWGHDSAPWIAETPSLEPERVTCTPTALVASLGVVDAVTYFYDYRSDSALPPPVGASAFLDNTSLNHLDPAADGGRVRRVFSASGEGLVAPTSAADDLARVCRSFSADTEVLMADGTTKPISDIEVGDEAWAADPETGEAGNRTVTAVWPHQDWLLDFTVEGGRITTTEDHHFWNATDNEWQEIQDIDRGDLLLTAEGHLVEAGNLDWTTGHYADAYDLTVAGLHTYFVVTGDDQVLVHNNPFVCAPSQSDVWTNLDRWRGKTRTNGLTGRNKEYYEWDYTHGEIEVYNSRGEHLGVMDALTGDMTKPAVSGRTIDVS